VFILGLNPPHPLIREIDLWAYFLMGYCTVFCTTSPQNYPSASVFNQNAYSQAVAISLSTRQNRHSSEVPLNSHKRKQIKKSKKPQIAQQKIQNTIDTL